MLPLTELNQFSGKLNTNQPQQTSTGHVKWPSLFAHHNSPRHHALDLSFGSRSGITESKLCFVLQKKKKKIKNIYKKHALIYQSLISYEFGLSWALRLQMHHTQIIARTAEPKFMVAG